MTDVELQLHTEITIVRGKIVAVGAARGVSPQARRTRIRQLRVRLAQLERALQPTR